jgi:hypothetical protein
MGFVTIDIEVDEFIGFPCGKTLNLPDRVSRMLVECEGAATHEDAILQKQNRNETWFEHG